MSQTVSASAYAEFLKSDICLPSSATGARPSRLPWFRLRPSPTPSHGSYSHLLNSVATWQPESMPRLLVSAWCNTFFAVVAEVDGHRRRGRLFSSRRLLGLGSRSTRPRRSSLLGGSPTLILGWRAARCSKRYRRASIEMMTDEYFRLAMLAYCTAELEGGGGADRARQVIGEWLRGELRLISAIRDMAIYQKIGRHNARLMIAAAAEWIRQSGKTGLVIVLDIERLVDKRDVGDNGLTIRCAAWNTRY